MSKFIYQISSIQPISTEEYIKSSYFDETGIIQESCQYVLSDESVQSFDAFEEFVLSLGGDHYSDYLVVDSAQRFITILPGFKEKWFENTYRQLKELMSQLTLTDFVDEVKHYEIQRLVAPAFTDFVYEEENGYPVRLEEFVLSLPTDRSVSFYVGGLVGMKC